MKPFAFSSNAALFLCTYALSAYFCVFSHFLLSVQPHTFAHLFSVNALFDDTETFCLSTQYFLLLLQICRLISLLCLLEVLTNC